MARVFVAVGSNIEPFTNIPLALGLLKKSVECEAVSCFYETVPVDCSDQPNYVNGVFLISTGYTPRELKFDVLKDIECYLGRKKTANKYAPRTIDLDIVLYDDLIIREPDIVIPDPGIFTRVFIAVPLCELDPDLIVPSTTQSTKQIASAFPMECMSRLDEFTDKLRMEL